jgi:Leucine-rich repeat (LRR) protein
LSDNQLKSLHWSSFSRLTSLKALNLARNQLRHIDGRLLATTTILKSLSLKDNKICKLNVERLFRSCCRVLKNLDLSGNLLDNVSTFFQSSTRTLTYVEQLFVNDNRLTNIDFVRDMTNLRVLELKNNGIASLLSREQNPNTPLCINLLGRLRYLARLELGGNSLTLETADDPAAFVESIFSKLVKNNTISDDFRYDSIVLKRGHSFNRDDCRAFSSDNWANKSMEDYTNL